MKKAQNVKIDLPANKSIQRALATVPGVEVEASPDGLVRVDDEVVPMIVQTVPYVAEASAHEVVDSAGAGSIPWLVLASEVSPGAQSTLARAGVNFVDERGNAHLRLPGVIVHVERAGRAAPRAASTIQLKDKAGLVGQALLLEPTRMWGVSDLADAAQVSVGLAHRVLTRLEGEHVVETEGSGPTTFRVLRNSALLLDLLVRDNRTQRPKQTRAYAFAQTPVELMLRMSDQLHSAGIEHAVTGSAAADVLAPFVTVAPDTAVWIEAAVPIEEALAATSSTQVSVGGGGANVRFMQANDDSPLFRAERVEGVRLANRVRIYLDLLEDPRRGAEQAEFLRQTVGLGR